jgi:hypothetical protein
MPTWLFQGSPKDFPAFDDYLRNYAEISWHVRQKRAAEEMYPDDEVYIWRLDGNRPGTSGIVAHGILTTEARAIPDEGKKSWVSHQPGPTVPSVDITLDDVRLIPEEGCLTRAALLQDAMLWNMHVVQSPHLTNYKLTPEEEERIATLWRAAKR